MKNQAFASLKQSFSSNILFFLILIFNLLPSLCIQSNALLAHGGQPKVLGLVFHGPSIPMVIDNLGLFKYDDQERDWRWMCDDAINAQTGLLTAFAFDQTLLATSRVGNYRSIDHGCGFNLIEGLIAEYAVGAYIQDTDPLKTNHIWAYSQSLGKYNDLFLSEDGGLSWQGKALMAEGIVYGFWQSKSQPQVIYVNHASGFLQSVDGGQTFKNLNIQIGDDSYRYQELRILGGHPNDANHLWITALRFPNSQLLESRDGGQTWTIIHEVADNYESLAFHEATSILTVSTPFEGFFRRLSDGTWENQKDDQLACLVYQNDRLWACGRGLPAKWLLAYSDDHGKTWIPKFEKYRDASRLVWDCDENASSIVACRSRCLSENCSPNGTKLDMQIMAEDFSIEADQNLSSEDRSDMSMLDSPKDLGIVTDQQDQQISESSNSKQGCQSNASLISLLDLLFYVLCLCLFWHDQQIKQSKRKI